VNPAELVDDGDHEEVLLVARGIATAVAPDTGLTPLQAELLGAIAFALTGVEIDYWMLEPLGSAELADVLARRDLLYRQRIVHHMVLAELVLRPLPTVVAHRVAKYAEALGVRDDFVRVARRYAQGAYGLAWMDLRRNGFVDHLRGAGDDDELRAGTGPGRSAPTPFEPPQVDPDLAARWRSFEDLPTGSLGRSVWEMYDSRGFALPGTPEGPPEYLAQHDFVHVLADYGTNLKGELEVFALIGRADPDPKGFAWLATLIGLFETGYIAGTGFFDRDVSERNVQAPGMNHRIADAIRRGKVVCEHYQVDLFDIDYHQLADRSVEEIQALLGVPPKSSDAIEGGSVGPFDPRGMSETQRRIAAERQGEIT
jgi:hypothetical protein